MSKTILTEKLARAIVIGGAVLGGGGGGSMDGGLENALLAINLGDPIMVSLDELDDNDTIITASAVGAPAAKDKMVRPVDHIRAMELVFKQLPKIPSGFIANENGGGSGVNGWIQAAITGLPVVDAPANGRAHPTGLMGAMGLNRLSDYQSCQSAVGGNPALGLHLEMVIQGRLITNANMVREAANQAGGFVAVVRDPITAAYARKNAAPGASAQAIKIGQAIIDAQNHGAEAVIKATVEAIGGQITCQGKITNIQLKTVGGYDIGVVNIQGDHSAELSFWNEFMTMEIGTQKIFFPDLITVLSVETGLPVSTAEAFIGQQVAVLTAPRNNLILGRGVLLPEAIQEAELALGRSLEIL